jgi:hypothetical protein
VLRLGLRIQNGEALHRRDITEHLVCRNKVADGVLILERERNRNLNRGEGPQAQIVRILLDQPLRGAEFITEADRSITTLLLPSEY